MKVQMTLWILVRFGVFLCWLAATEARAVWRRQANSVQDCDCRDWYGGCRHVGDAWTDDNTWKYTCTQGGLTLSACVGSDRIGGRIIAAGTNQTIDGFWYSCTDESNLVRYKQEHSCQRPGQPLLHVGNTFRDSNTGTFKLQCAPWGIDVVGCYFKDTELGELELQVGQEVEAACYKHRCIKASEIPWKVQYIAQPIPSCEGRVTDGGTATSKAVTVAGDKETKATTTAAPLPLPQFSESFFVSDGTYDEKIRFKQP